MKQGRDNARGRCSEANIVTWKPPEEGRLKMNVDAHIIAGSPWFSCGLILRDHKGNFIKVRVRKFAGKVPVDEAEATGVLEAIQWIISMALQNVDIESDSLSIVQAINKSRKNWLEVGVVLNECRTMLGTRSDISISFAKKHANKVAHLIARVPCDVGGFIDMLTPPRSVLEYFVRDNLMN